LGQGAGTVKLALNESPLDKQIQFKENNPTVKHSTLCLFSRAQQNEKRWKKGNLHM